MESKFHKSLFYNIKPYAGIIFIFSLGLALRLYIAQIDPMLHDWDERFHALVAKNIIQHPLKPMLYVNQYFDTDPFNWTYNHIWLHKQPLFLWQMALSMKIFGTSELAMRLPSVLMGSLMIVLLYRITLIVSKSKWAALFAALLLACNNYQLNLISGREGMDHNDIAFGFYVLASFWAYAEYLYTQKTKWIILIGIFAGCAILNKWLTGLLVFAPWGIQAIIDIVKNKKWQSLIHLLIALLICTIVFAPWQIYILTQFHDIAQHEYQLNTQHIWSVVEGHNGGIWYYLNHFPDYFGWQINYFVPIGLILLTVKKSIPYQYKLLLGIPTIIVFCFFSFLVQTKVTGFFFVVAPLCLVLSAIALLQIKNWAGKFGTIATFVLVPICIYYAINIEQINKYSNETSYRPSKIYNDSVYQNLNKLIPKDIHIVVNCNQMEHVDIMFYNNELEAYHHTIPEKEFIAKTKNGIKIAAFESRDNYPLPDYIRKYPNLYIIPAKLR